MFGVPSNVRSESSANLSSNYSQSNLIDSLHLLERLIYQIGCPILICIGFVGSIMNLIVFTQKNLRRNPCSIYFIMHDCANIIYICVSLILLTLEVGYNVDPSSQYLSVCRIRLYFSVVFNILSPFYLILASIDRVLITSPHALVRQLSTRRLAYVLIISGTLFWLVFHVHLLIYTNIIQIGPNLLICYFQQGTYMTFIGYYSILKESLTFLLLIILGFWFIKNIRRKKHARTTINDSNNASARAPNHLASSKDRQLILMLTVGSLVYGSFSLCFGIFLTYQQITQNSIKSYDQIHVEEFIRYICLFSVGIPFCSGCYTNYIVSKTFRQQIKKIISC